MSDKLMDTAPGGENTQYESIKTVTQPESKNGGQMGTPETKSADSAKSTSEVEERGERTAENIRYGQNISESGMGGMTTTTTGQANDGGYGDVAEQSQSDSTPAGSRTASGYGGKQDMDEGVGA